MQPIPALHRLRTSSAVYFIDEIDRSLHPMPVRAFPEAFLKSGGGQGQIIVTNHESSLSDRDVLRRGEIWFAEKDDSGATRLYSPIDFKVRNDLEIRKHCLPFPGSLDCLVEDFRAGAVSGVSEAAANQNCGGAGYRRYVDRGPRPGALAGCGAPDGPARLR